ncbi:hypothetical protein ACI48J_19135 [Paenibacillus chitinolyticus]|uniref:hypothetical protein n=1 Tax=Paenibacillus chitinolyticus TaxID=79263 RepID=UPI00386921C1
MKKQRLTLLIVSAIFSAVLVTGLLLVKIKMDAASVPPPRIVFGAAGCQDARRQSALLFCGAGSGKIARARGISGPG